MAREVKLVDKSQSVWYTPAAFGNRESADPFRVLVAPMSAADFQLISAVAVRKMSRLAEKTDDDSVAEVLGNSVADTIIRKHVIGVQGYRGRDAAGRLVEPKDGDSLLAVIYGAGSEELALRIELAQALQDSAELSQGLEKKSVGPSASSAQETSRPTAGLARSAGDTPAAQTRTPTQLSS